MTFEQFKKKYEGRYIMLCNPVLHNNLKSYYISAVHQCDDDNIYCTLIDDNLVSVYSRVSTPDDIASTIERIYTFAK